MLLWLVVMDFQTCKNLGGVGALLMFIGPLLSFAHAFGVFVSLVGFILLLISLKGFSDHYNDAGIFNNALYGFITAIAGVVIAGVIFVATAINVLADYGLTNWTHASEWAATLTPELAMDLGVRIWRIALVSLVIVFVFAIITALLYRNSLRRLASKSGVGLFDTAGLLLLIGAVLIIVLVGALIIWIAILLVTIAFFSMKPPVEPAEQKV